MHRTEMLPLLRLQLVLLRAVAWRRAEAQASLPPTSVSPSPGNYSVKINPALASVLIAFICGFFLLGFFSVYLRRCAEDSDVVAARDGAGFVDGEAVAGGRRRRGLDREVLETLPTMAYAKAKELRAGKEAMECAVCLSEFSDEDILRVLPGCCHVFHVDCVDVWLESHVTCPVCRANLSDPAVLAADRRTPAEATAGNEDSTEEEAEGVRHGNDDMEAGLGGETATGAPEDRHTLRLPEHVRREILEAGRLRRAASLTVPSGGEASGRRGYRADAGAGRSGRWGFLLRTFSVRRRPEVAPVPARSASSSKRIFPSDGAPSSVTVGDGGAECKSGSDKKDEVSLSEPAEERV